MHAQNDEFIHLELLTFKEKLFLKCTSDVLESKHGQE